MDLSIIIISKDTKQLLKACIASIFATLKNCTFSYEIIVIDNGSTDGSLTFLKTLKNTVHVIENKINRGFGTANNQGIRYAKGEYVLLLNSDTEVLPGAVENLLVFARSHTSSFVGPKLLNSDTSSQTSCGPFFSLPIVFMILFLKGDALKITRWSPNKTMNVDWVSGACVIAQKKTFMDDLLFDENIFMYMDEIDLLYRAKKKGYNVYFYPDSRVIHLGSGSSKNKKKGPIINIFKGFQWFYEKHHPGWQTRVLKGMLQCKAIGGVILGVLTGNTDLKSTYEEAYRMVQ
jgi:GT2 family glycosyltransferase